MTLANANGPTVISLVEFCFTIIKAGVLFYISKQLTVICMNECYCIELISFDFNIQSISTYIHTDIYICVCVFKRVIVCVVESMMFRGTNDMRGKKNALKCIILFCTVNTHNRMNLSSEMSL